MSASVAKTYQAGTLTYTKGGLAVLFLWLLWGDFCFTLMEAVTPSLVQVKFMELQAPKTLVGVFMTSVPAIINFVCNPIISFKSDRFRSRWGRRIPFILVTMPMLVACLAGLGFADQIGAWVRHLEVARTAWGWMQALGWVGEFTPVAGALMAVCFFLTLFSFFNTFVNSVFWYLFNDVVPEQLLSRFVSWFKVVSVGAGALYQLFIFSHAKTHYMEIFIGAGLLYFIGFGVMCLRVREGSYPPPPPYTGGRTGVWAAMGTYGRECMARVHYWWLFGACMGLVMAVSMWQFSIFYQTELLGLSLKQIGQLQFAGAITQVCVMPVAGWLADRFHPIRVALAGAAISLLAAPQTLMWHWWSPGPDTVFWVQLGIGIGISAPVGCLISMMDPPLFMRIFPRERYGQFCSANSMLRSVAQILCGTLSGLYLDQLTNWTDKRFSYCLMGLWSMMGFLIMLACLLGLYRSWHRHGGDKSYVPPLPRTN